MAASNSSSLSIHELSLWVNLGIRDIEKTERQEIRASIEMNFLKIPTACNTDKIEDTTCYHELCRQIIATVESRQYNMIEKLAHDIATLIKTKSEPTTSVKVTLHKVHPPIARLQGGISFTLTC